MKSIQLFLLTLVWLASACNSSKEYEAKQHLTEQEATHFKQKIIRYVATLPKRGTDENKFENRFNEHYLNQMSQVRLDKYYPSKDGYIYFETSRIAPSFKVKRAATAGKLKFDQSGTITEYEEVYRTWKMEEEELKEKTSLLFAKLVANEDLSPFLTENSAEEFIEFPDVQVKYDKEKRRWVGNESILQARP